MRLRRWGAVAAAALVVAGCGSTVAGQASPASPGLVSPPVVSGGSTAASTAATTNSSTSLSVATFPSPSGAVSSGAVSSGAVSSGAVSSGAESSTPTTGGTVSTPVSNGPPPATPTTATPSTTVKWLLPLPKAGTDKENKFGNVIAAPGQSFAIQWRSNKQIAVVFVVDSLQVDKGCEATVKPQNGHLLVISIRVQLGYATGQDLSDAAIGFTDNDWTAFDAKDTAQVDTSTSATDACVTYKTEVPFANELEPGKVYSGKIALDVSSTTGTAVLMTSLEGGWVYHYG